ncbi:MAG: hypothetical protein A2666_01630, partial [Parcubacteria group bacterium RIFCSPHIGHO2_01_FULL_47_10b]
KAGISVRDATNNKNVPFRVQYHSIDQKNPRANLVSGEPRNFFFALADILTKNSRAPGAQVSDDSVDASVIEIYPQRDRFGRADFWDFDTSYSITIDRAFPAEGDIVSNQQNSFGFTVPNIIKDTSATSKRTNLVNEELIDPEGEVVIDFYEDIDNDRSDIVIPHQKSVVYGEKCIEGDPRAFEFCDRETNKSQLRVTFHANEIQLGEVLGMQFQKVVNVAGITLNPETMTRTVKAPPVFKITKLINEFRDGGANLEEMVVCSNSPIARPVIDPTAGIDTLNDAIRKHLTISPDHELGYWGESWWATDYKNSCTGVDRFLTTIRYGLMPSTNYTLALKADDVFGQHATAETSFHSGKLPNDSENFLHFQSRYSVTTPDKTRLTYAVKNMTFVNLDICKIRPDQMLRYLDSSPAHYDPVTATRPCIEQVSDQIQLPNKFWVNNQFSVDLKKYFANPLGHYVLTFSNPDYDTETWIDGRTQRRDVYERTYISVTNLGVAEKKIDPQTQYFYSAEPLTPEELGALQNLYWVTNLKTLDAVLNARVETYHGDAMALRQTVLTNKEGVALAKVLPDSRGVIVTSGNDSTLLYSGESMLNYASSAASAKRMFLYTDKPIYKPGETVHFKGIYRLGFDGNYEIFRDKQVSAQLFDSQGQELERKMLDVNEYGTFNADFVTQANGPLGTYRICVDDQECTYVDFEQYVPAPFETAVTADKEEYLSRDTATFNIVADYYFGVPVEGGEATYSLVSQNYYFDKYSDPDYYYSFAASDRYDPYGSDYYGDSVVAQGITTLDANGKGVITQSLNFSQLFEESKRGSKIMTLYVTVKNPQGQSVSAQTSFVAHASEIYLGINLSDSFIEKNAKTTLRAKSVTYEGKPTRVHDIILKAYRLEWTQARRQEADGGFSYKWEQKREPIEAMTKQFSTNGDGNYETELSFDKEGEYETELTITDDKGNTVRATYSVYVYGEGQASVQPYTDTTLEVRAAKPDVKVGETAEIIFQSPYPKAKALVAIERGKIFEYQILPNVSNVSNYLFNVRPEYVPNVYVSVLVQAPNPEVKFGSTGFNVDTEQRELHIDVKTDKTAYLPGEEVALSITTTDYQGNPVPAEVSLAVVDLSVLALKGNPKENPLVFFYGGLPLTVSTASNVKNILVQQEHAGGGDKGGGGSSTDELAAKKRGEFRDTAFWGAVARTNMSGKAVTKFTLPDNLTTWQSETIGVTKATQLGVNYSEFVSRKELMVVPLKPRFVVPGDTFSIGAKVFNQSDHTVRPEISLTSATLKLIGASQNRESLSAGETKTVYFSVQAPEKMERGKHTFTLQADAGELVDIVEQSIAITANDTFETVATAAYTAAPQTVELVYVPDSVVQDKGELTVQGSATLAVFVTGALESLLSYPIGLTDSLANQLHAIAAVKKAIAVPNFKKLLNVSDVISYNGETYTMDQVITKTLDTIYSRQDTYTAGFTYWQGGQPSAYTTLTVIEALDALTSAGVAVDQDRVRRASQYAYSEITNDYYRFKYSKESIINLAYTIRNYAAVDQKAELRRLLSSFIADKQFFNEGLSNNSLAYLGLAAPYFVSIAQQQQVYKLLDNRIEIDSRGAFLEMNNNFAWWCYETPVSNTALYLQTQIARPASNPIIDKVLRWLLAYKQKDGSWGSTHDTMLVVNAFIDYLVQQQENQSDFTLQVSVDDKKLLEQRFGGDTILSQATSVVPIGELRSNDYSRVVLSKKANNTKPNTLYYDASLRYFIPAEQIKPRDEGFGITRAFYPFSMTEAWSDVGSSGSSGNAANKNAEPVTEAKVGQLLRAHIEVIVPKSRRSVVISDVIPAGMEIVNTNLATESQQIDSALYNEMYGYQGGQREFDTGVPQISRQLYAQFKEARDDRMVLYMPELGPGVYSFDYVVRPLIPGTFIHLPATVTESNFTENFGRTGAGIFKIEK